MLDKAKHQLVLKQLLREIFTDNELTAQLVFKGGTALMLFDGLDRFSTDLNFDLRSGAATFDFERLFQCVTAQLNIRDATSKRSTYLIEGSYQAGAQQIKIEVSKRQFPQKFTIHYFLGLSIPVLSSDYLLAHKLCAITTRKTILGRDIYDADFMFKKNWQPNAEIVAIRTNLSLSQYYEVLRQKLGEPTVSQNIMLGLGEVLSPQKRKWASQNLVKSLTEQLLLRI